MSKPECPTILYPNGNEVFFTNEILIRWNSITNFSSTEYELYYTDDFDEKKEPDWELIAHLPSSTVSFLWKFSKQLRSSKCRIAIRSRNMQGEKSEFSISANNFSLRRQKLITPNILSPLPSETYDRFIEIITDDSGIRGTYTQRSFYQIYYSSLSANIVSTPIAQNVQVGTDPIFWNTTNLPAANDYIIQIYLSDGDGNVSDSVFINVVIKHEGFFIVDTVPPVGAIVLNNNAAFTKTRDVKASLAAYDAATGVHSIQLLDDGDGSALPDIFSDVKTYTLSEINALKTVQLKLQDFGGNRNDQQIQNIFQNIVNSGIIDVIIDSNGIAWAITETYQLYKVVSFPTLVTTLTLEPTALGALRTSIYVAVKTDANKGELLLVSGNNTVLLNTFTTVDSVINTMAALGNTLYIGMENGAIYSYDGLTFTNIQTMANPIKYMFSDGNILYLILKNDFSLYIFNGTIFLTTGALNA